MPSAEGWRLGQGLDERTDEAPVHDEFGGELFEIAGFRGRIDIAADDSFVDAADDAFIEGSGGDDEFRET